MSDWSTTNTGPRAPLTRSNKSMIAGVASGFGEFAGINPIIVRALFAVLALAGGAGFLAYIGLWLLIPGPGYRDGDSRAPQGLAAGGALLLLAAMVGLMALVGIGQPLNLILLAVLFAGITILNRQPNGWALASASASGASTFDPPFASGFAGPLTSPDPDPIFDTSSFSSSDAATAPVTEPMPAPMPGPISEPLSGPGSAKPDPSADPTVQMGADAAVPGNPLAESDPSWPPPNDDSNPSSPGSETGSAATAAGSATERPVASGAIPTMDQIQRSHWAMPKVADETVDRVVEPPEPPGPPLGLIAVAATAAVLGVALVLNTIADIFVGATTVVGLSMAVVGLLFTVGAFKGRVLPLVPMAIGLLILLPASPVIDHAITDGIGSSYVAVNSADDLLPAYRVGIGELNLDLSDFELTETTVVEAEVGTGALFITVPRDIPVLAQGETAVGTVWILGEGRGGLGNNLRVRPPSSFDEDAPVLIIDASTDIGNLEIHRSHEHPFSDQPEVDLDPVFEDLELPEPPELPESPERPESPELPESPEPPESPLNGFEPVDAPESEELDE